MGEVWKSEEGKCWEQSYSVLLLDFELEVNGSWSGSCDSELAGSQTEFYAEP